MNRADAIHTLKANEAKLRRMGIEHLSLFGSTARGDQRSESDVDLAAAIDPNRTLGVFGYLAIEEQLAQMLGVPVDLISEPARNPRLQAEIDGDRIRVF